MTDPFEVVYIAYGALSAETIRLFLESNGVPAQTSQEAAGTVYGLTVGSLGKVKILVPQERSEEARDLLRRMDEGEFILPENGEPFDDELDSGSDGDA